MRAIQLVKRKLPWANAPGVALIGRMKRAITTAHAAAHATATDEELKKASHTFDLHEWKTIIMPEYMCRAAIEAAEREIAYERVYHEVRTIGSEKFDVYRMVTGDMCCGQKRARQCNCNSDAPDVISATPAPTDAWSRAHTNGIRVVVVQTSTAAQPRCWSYIYSETCNPAGGVFCTPPDARFSAPRESIECGGGAAFYALFVEVLKETFQARAHVAQTDTDLAAGEVGVGVGETMAMAMAAATDDLARLEALYHMSNGS